MLPLHFDCKYSGNFKRFVSPEPLGSVSWWGILHAKKYHKCTMLSFKFQGTFFKKRLSNLRGMNPIELSSVLLGKFGMQKRETTTNSKCVC